MPLLWFTTQVELSISYARDVSRKVEIGDKLEEIVKELIHKIEDTYVHIDSLQGKRSTYVRFHFPSEHLP